MRLPTTIRIPAELATVYLRELKPGELKVLLVLVMKYQTLPSQNISISRRELATVTGLSLRAITTAAANLQSLGLIQIQKTNDGYAIRLLHFN